MRRVVVTGLGIVSSIGNDAAEVTESLRQGKSGIEFCEEYRDMGFRSQVCGTVKLNLDQVIDRKVRRFMGDGAAYNYIAMQEAIGDAYLTDDLVSNERTGLVVGSGGPSTRSMLQAIDTTREKVRAASAYMVPRCMSSTNSANLATSFHIKGVNYSITSACATSAHCIGHGADLIRLGRQDIVFAGGGEEIDWTLSVLFDGMAAMSSHYNDDPTRASRAYDADRDGFVISGGGGVVVLEDYEHAKARGAKIYAEIVGYGATSDGVDMVQPSVDGQARCMRQALADVGGQKVDYLNTHGTSTPVGDTREIEACEVFGGAAPRFSSTKSLTGHSQGATGVHEAIYTLLMLRDDFITASANIEKLDPEIDGMPVVTERIDKAGLDLVMTNSFGFGGTNASIVFKRHDG